MSDDANNSIWDRVWSHLAGSGSDDVSPAPVGILDSTGPDAAGGGPAGGQAAPSSYDPTHWDLLPASLASQNVGTTANPSLGPYAWSDNNGRTVYIARPDNSLEVRTGGTLTWRNNNPGNVRNSTQEIGQNDSQSGRLAIFDTPEAGQAAQSDLLSGPMYSGLTIGGMIGKYAPPSENDTAAYIANVERHSGLGQSMPMVSLDDQQRADLLNAMRTQEGYRVGTVQRGYYNPFGSWQR